MRRGGGPLAVLALAQAATTYEFTVAFVALPAVVTDLDVPPTLVAWVPGAYAATFGGGLLAAGRLVDRHGVRPVVALAPLALAATTAAVALASSPAVLLAGRAGQGLAAAVLQPAVLAAMTRVATGPARARAWGVWSAVGAGGLAAGTSLGGMLAAVDWRLAVGVVVPVCLLVAGRAGVLPPAPDVLVGERSATPLRGSDLRRRPDVRLGAVLAAVYMAGPGALYFLLTTTPGSSGRAGLLLLPLTLGVVAGCAAAGRVVARLGEERGAGLGFAVATVGTAGLALGPGSVVGPVACSLLAGLGSGTAFTAVFALAGRDVPEHRRGTAGAVVASAQYLASTVALAAFGALDGTAEADHRLVLALAAGASGLGGVVALAGRRGFAVHRT
jgi:MFS family permease